MSSRLDFLLTNPAIPLEVKTAQVYAATGDEEDKTYICGIVNELAEITPRGQPRPYWPLPVEIVGFSSFISDEEGLAT